MITKKRLQHIAYERYKLLWMIRYDQTLLDIAERIVYEERAHPEYREMVYTDAAFCLLRYAETKAAEEGERIYPSLNNFLSGVYQDEATMSFILTSMEKEAYDYYKKGKVPVGLRFSGEGDG